MSSEQDFRWNDEPVEEVSATRGRRVLNGLWRFMPAVAQAVDAPEGAWGTIWVPGAWHRQGRTAPPLNGVCEQLDAAPWDELPLARLGRAWYERGVTVPESWSGREIVLNVDRLCTDALVFVDGEEIGRINWPHGRLTLTPHVEPGRAFVLRMLVVCTPEEEKVEPLLRGEVAMDEGAGGSYVRGLSGDVILESRPAGARIESVYVKTSVREKTLSLDVDLADVAKEGVVELTAEIANAEGKVVRTFDAHVDVQGAPQQTVQVAFDWPDPKLWDFRQPNLYTLRLQALGTGLADEYVERFGFREFRIKGKQFLLNGKPFRIRPIVAKVICNGVGMREAIENQTDSLLAAGYNTIEVWPKTEMNRGLAIYWKLRADVSDEKGVPLIYPALNLSGFVTHEEEDEERWQAWETAMVEEWKKVRNHPSIVAFVCTANVFQHYDDQNPAAIGNLKKLAADKSDKLATLYAPGFRCIETIKKCETARPVTTHHGASVGDFQACDSYLNMIPLQEREEWLSAWAGDDEAGPYMNIEFGTPWSATFHRGRNSGGHARVTEPFLTEYCAIYFGSDAYRDEGEAYRRMIREYHRGNFDFRMWPSTGNHDYNYCENNLRLQSLFIGNTWKSWRTYGMTGGLLPWANGYAWAPSESPPEIELPPFEPGRVGPYVSPEAFEGEDTFGHAEAYYYGLDGYTITDAGRTLVEVNSDTLAWVAGPPDAFPDKQHTFFPGETVEKQMVLINDTRSSRTYLASWRATIDGDEPGAGRQSGNIAAGSTAFIPFGFPLPEAKAAATGRIQIEATIGDVHHRDSFEFRVLPRPRRSQSEPTVAAFDPEGDTTAYLERLGLPTEPWDGEPGDGSVLVVGRNALSGGHDIPGSLERFVAEGGRAVVFGQDPDWLREKAGLRVARHVSRRFFPVPFQVEHPVLRGLSQDDFRDWRGSGTLVPPTRNTALDKDFSDMKSVSEGRRYGWHWGNRGSVSSAAVEKPHLSGWRPILEGEFDLAYSPLMELHYGSGLALWCSLDVEGRSSDEPVAEVVTRRLLHYARTAKNEPRMEEAVYYGGADGAELLDLLGLDYEEVGYVPVGKVLLVMGPEAEADDGVLTSFLYEGGRVLQLGRPNGSACMGFRAEMLPYHGTMDVPPWNECLGLSESDLRLRVETEAPLLTHGVGEMSANGMLGRMQVGAGVVVLMQISPYMLNTEQETYLRFSQWRLTRATAQILSNMGAHLAGDRALLKALGGESTGTPDLYCPDYRTDFSLGDDPYRYKRW